MSTNSVPSDYVQGFARLVGSVKTAVDEYNAAFRKDNLVFLAPILNDEYKIDKLQLVRDEARSNEGDASSTAGCPSSPSEPFTGDDRTAKSVTFAPEEHLISEHGSVCSSPRATSPSRPLTEPIVIDSSSDIDSSTVGPSSDTEFVNESWPPDSITVDRYHSTEVRSRTSRSKSRIPEDERSAPRVRDSTNGFGFIRPSAVPSRGESPINVSRSRVISMCRSEAPPPSDRSQTVRLSPNLPMDDTQTSANPFIEDETGQRVKSSTTNAQEEGQLLEDGDVNSQQTSHIDPEVNQHFQRSPAVSPSSRDNAIFAPASGGKSPVTPAERDTAIDAQKSPAVKARARTPPPQRHPRRNPNGHRKSHQPWQNVGSDSMRGGSRCVQSRPSARWSPILPWSPNRKRAIEASWRQTLDFTIRGMDISNGLFTDRGDDSDD
ncbi:hypothetical protein CkaCkLH20_00276 [Colletotrichum karsti]|uniref:Uncharacterized protein n=1 Tax=Colletotrichum karsti TaxID=1095194 RepID=A0A9P6LQI1_9PEZI|nr:uncharacterized protein CkaCkLH20_00276 [Colletotrichum karsti]KAF9882240.1 hypothetical protein CkaCkLH20_00276 [Colletotrichum karsti]